MRRHVPADLLVARDGAFAVTPRIGRFVPGLVRQQLEGAIVFGLSAALHGEIVIAGGRVQQTSFRNQDILHMDDCPPIETDILPSDAPPAGVGEAGTPPIAPAVANAWFALTGQRIRELPLGNSIAFA